MMALIKKEAQMSTSEKVVEAAENAKGVIMEAKSASLAKSV